MNFRLILSDSLTFTKATFLNKWIRWLILILLTMPVGLFLMIFIPESLLQWNLTQKILFGLLLVINLILSVILAGYGVRIFRGAKEPVEFDHLNGLFVDGLKAIIVMLLYMVPLIILMILTIGTNITLLLSAGQFPTTIGTVQHTNIMLFTLSFFLLVYTILLLPIGVIQFARSGSVREGMQFLKAQEYIDRLGWGNYLLAYILLAVIIAISYIGIGILSYVPFIGPIIFLSLLPVLLIFSIRYMTCVYESASPEINRNKADCLLNPK